MDLDAVLDEINRLIEEKGSATLVADYFGVRPQFISAILHGRKQPSAKILSKLGYAREVVIRAKKGGK